MLRAREVMQAGERVAFFAVGEHEEPTTALILAAMDAAARRGNTGCAPIARCAPTSRTAPPAGPEPRPPPTR